MTTPELIADLKADEGYAKALPNGSCEAYPDPLSGGDPWTIGFGATGPDICKGTIWTQAQADSDLAKRIDDIEDDLDAQIAWWRGMSDLRQDVVCNMAYNLGVAGLMSFRHTLAAMRAGEYNTAADAMLNSAWATQVPHRAQRLAEQMRTGVHA